MTLEFRQKIKLQQNLQMTPELQQAIKILQFSHFELESFLNDQLASNPVLEDAAEMLDEKPVFEHASKREKGSEGNTFEDRNFSSSRDSAFSVKRSFFEGESNYEEFSTKEESLKDSLIHQISSYRLTEREGQIAFLLIDGVDENGYLLVDEALLEGDSFSHKTFEKVLSFLQKCEPLGVCARSLSECLMIQAKSLFPEDKLLYLLIERHLEDFASGKHKKVAQNLKISFDLLLEKLELILTLDAKPGRSFSSFQPSYITPDLYVHKSYQGWEVSLEKIRNENLSINHFYQKLNSSSKKAEEKTYLKVKMKEAKWLLKSLEQRRVTLIKVMKAILKRQEDFFLYGKEHLKPLILKEIAEETNLHESTISRVTSNKFVYTDRGTFELRSFFNSRVKSSEGSSLSSSVARLMIKKIVEEEDKTKPFSDSKIKDLLKEKGVDIARRTVAKYREQLSFLPSSRRTRYH